MPRLNEPAEKTKKIVIFLQRQNKRDYYKLYLNQDLNLIERGYWSQLI